MHSRLTWILGVSLAAAAHAAGFKSLAADSDGGTSDVSCDTIAGVVGLVVDWTHTAPTNKSLRSENGECGATWNGSKVPMCALLPNNVREDSRCQHIFERDGGSTNVSISLTTAMLAGGQASQADVTDPSWWWNPSVDIYDSPPRIFLRDTNGNELEVGWANITDAWDPISAVGTGGALGPPAGGTLTAGFAANPGGGTSGSFAATSGPIAQQQQWSEIRIRYYVHSIANRSSDNAKVQGWKVVLKSTMVTSVP